VKFRTLAKTIENAQKLYLFEIKSAATVTNHHAISLKRAKNDISNVETAAVISAAKESYPLADGIYNYRWQDILLR